MNCPSFLASYDPSQQGNLRPLTLLAIACLTTVATSSGARAEPTEIAVRVLAKGAKFVGGSMGGARVIVADADTGEKLAEGLTAGGTGDTDRIMRTALDRKGARWTSGAAEFRARIDIETPRRVRIAASGPMAQRQAATTASVEAWLLPGRDVLAGDAFTIELPGFAVDVLSPAAHSTASGAVEITANIVMMCGCPVTPGGLWDADGYDLTARISKDGREVAAAPMVYAGTPSRFSTTFEPSEAGVYTIEVSAFDAANGNAGVDWTTVIVSDPE